MRREEVQFAVRENPLVVCIGQIVADVVVRRVDRLPPPGELVLVDDLRLVSGGCAANTAAVLAKLGTRCRLTGLVGSEAMGSAVLADQRSWGVDIDFVKLHPSLPTSSVIVVVSSDGERSFLYREGSSDVLTLETVLPALEGAGHAHIAGSLKLGKLDKAALLRQAKEGGMSTSVDTDWDPSGRWLAQLIDALPYCDVLITSLEEGRHLTRQTEPTKIGLELLDYGPAQVVVKCGREGSYLVAKNGYEYAPAYPVNTIDSTCAGDAFVAGFIHGLVRDAAPLACLKFANACGGLATTDVSHHGIVSSEAPMSMAFGERL